MSLFLFFFSPIEGEVMNVISIVDEGLQTKTVAPRLTDRNYISVILRTMYKLTGSVMGVK
jgi:hypothetical protein